MRIETNKDKKLEIYVPGQRKGFPLVAIGFVVVAVLTLIGTISAQKQENYRNNVIASNGGSVLSSNNVPEECEKGGINFAGGFGHMSPANFERAQSHSMQWVLAIAVNPDEAASVADRIKAAAGYNLTTIVRICYHDNCGFKNSGDYVNFLKNIASQTSGVDFYALAGPNEPLNENWLPGTEHVPIPVPANDEQLDLVARKVAEYMNAIISGVRGTDNVHLLSPAFNMTTYLKEELHDGMVKYGANFAGLEGIAGNLYNVQGTTITQWVNEAKAMYPGQDLYITETGDFDHNVSRLAGEVKNTLYADGQIKAFLLFNAFATNPDPSFTYAHLTDSEIKEVLGGECSNIIPDGEVPTTIGDLVSSCPFDGDFSHDLESCQIDEDFTTLLGGESKTTPATADCGPGTELCGEVRIAKCGANATSEECASGLVPNDGQWHGGYYITGLIEGKDPGEGIPTLAYLQSATGDYAQDIKPDGTTRDIQEIPPCFYRNTNNYFNEVDFGLKFDGRIGVTADGKTDYIPFPVLGTAAGCLYYNQNDFYGGFNQLSSGFIKSNYSLSETKETVTASTESSVNSDGEVKGIFDFISGVVLAIQGFVQKTFFNSAVSNYEIPTTFCSTNGSGVTLPALPVKKLNTADVVAAAKSYEAVLEHKEESLTDTALCDRQFGGEKDVEGVSCRFNNIGCTFTIGSPQCLTGYDSTGNPLYTSYDQAKQGNNGQVDSATGNPVLKKDKKRTDEISLDGMKRALASAYLDEAIFFHGLGTRPGLTQVSTRSDTPSGFRVIHNMNVGVEVPLTTKMYDILKIKGVSNYTCTQGVCTPIVPPDVPSAQTQCDAGEFYTGSLEPAEGKSIGRDYYVIPWMAQIPRMYARIAAVGTNYEVSESGDLVGTDSGIGALDAERIPLCTNAGPGEDCLVPASDDTVDPLFKWLVDEGVLSEAEIKGSFGQAGTITPGEGDMCTENPDPTSLNQLIPPVDPRVTTLNFGYCAGCSYGSFGAFHSGQDYGAASGDNILASGDGVVEYIRKGLGTGYFGFNIGDLPPGFPEEYKKQPYNFFIQYGNMVAIRHIGENQSEMFWTLYAHMKDVNVNVGDTVKQDDIIGTMDSSGNSSGTHLHYEIRVCHRWGSGAEDCYVNPERLFKEGLAVDGKGNQVSNLGGGSVEPIDGQDECKEIAPEEGGTCNEFNCFGTGVTGFQDSLACASSVSYIHRSTDEFVDRYGPFCDNETYVLNGQPHPLPFGHNYINFYDKYMSDTGATRRDTYNKPCTILPPTADEVRDEDFGMECRPYSERVKTEEYQYYRGALASCSIPVDQTYWTPGNTFGHEDDPEGLARYLVETLDVDYYGHRLSNTPIAKVEQVMKIAKEKNINPFMLLGVWATESWFGQACPAVSSNN